MNRLKRLKHTNTSSVSLEDFQYDYNPDDEIKAITLLAPASLVPQSKTATAADAANRISQFGGASYSFNQEGETITKIGTSGTTGYQWDARGRLKQATLPNGQIVNYDYDALGRRVSRIANGSATTFVYDGVDVVMDQGDGGAIGYLNGLGIDDKLRQLGGTSGTLYYLQDHLGSTAALTSASGVLLEQRQYEAFGDNAGSVRTRYGYTGREQDDLTGLIYYRARWYDSLQGRFLNEDPLEFKAGINFYTYTENDPIGLNDPTGLYPPSHPRCQSLQRRIVGLAKEIAKRIGEMHDDKLKLPWRAPGDRQKPSLSRWGHEKIINEAKAKKAELEGYYAAECNDSEPPAPPAPVPCPAPNPNPKPSPAPAQDRSINPAIKTGAGVAAGLGLGYLLYRGVRLAPSLYPPLWWTLPGNLATP